MRAERQKIPSASEIDIRKAKMREAVFGHPASVRSGSQPQNTDQFRSQQELINAMSDSRYENDPAYRQDVMDKLTRSPNVNF